MKYPDRLGRRGANPFHSVVSTTFSIEFAALEEIMLPQLMATGATNFLVIADQRMASMSMADGSQRPRQLGRDYELFSPPVADGLFHPKLVLQLGRRSGRLFVGSANISAAGLAGNAETVVELECTDEPSAKREIIRATWYYLSGMVERQTGAARDAVDWAAARAPWLAGPQPGRLQQLDDGTSIAFLVRQDRLGIARQFVDLVDDGPVERLIVISPYWDERLDALDFLTRALAPAASVVLLDLAERGFPVDAPLPDGTTFRDISAWRKGRFTHAKIMVASTAAHDHVLIGSANCTTAALGNDGFEGSNAEACLYRRLLPKAAIEALELASWLEEEALDPDSIPAPVQTPPIPLREIASRRAGSFELEDDRLTWTPPGGLSGRGAISLQDVGANEIERIMFDELGSQHIFHLTAEKPQRIGFAVVEQLGFRSNPAHVTHRSLLRRRRREVASGAVARAVAVFDPGADFDLWMHQAFDDLVRADLADRPAPSIASVKPRTNAETAKDEAPQHLTYEEFMEMRAPDERSESRRDSTLAGTHSDSIRSFLNMLVGRPVHPAPQDEPEGDNDNDWMDLGDEDPDQDGQSENARAEGEPDAPAPAKEKINDKAVDAGLYGRMVRSYVSNLTGGDEALGPGDVLRLRFWLMMLIHKARHPGLPNGLESDTGEKGWPRLAMRVISAFFCGKRPPITRLMVARGYTVMPVDFLETWATVLWTLDAIEGTLAGPVRNRQFLGFVRKLRVDVMGILGLTPAELANDVVGELRRALDRSVGARLGLDSDRILPGAR